METFKLIGKSYTDFWWPSRNFAKFQINSYFERLSIKVDTTKLQRKVTVINDRIQHELIFRTVKILLINTDLIH